MIALVLSVLAASFAGSVHCAAMCGGFVAFTARASGGVRPWVGPLVWQMGRLVAYLTLGALAGVLGAGIDHAGHWAGLHRAAAVVAGVTMIAWGLRALVATRQGAAAPAGIGAGLHRTIGRLVRVMSAWPTHSRAWVLGAATALLPCGFLWAFVTAAAATGQATQGSLVMLACWAGTFPALLGVTLVARRALGPLEQRLPQLTAIALVVIGLLTVAGRIGPMERQARSGPAMSTHDCH